MLVFIDESGDPGFKLEKGSSQVFVVAMVIFDDHDVAHQVDSVIDAIREPTRHRSEFKFSKCHENVRDAFFKAVAPHEFCVRAIAVHKERIYSPALRGQKELFYNFFVRMLMQHDGDVLENAIVKIDESGDRRFKKELSTYLRRQLKGRVRKVRTVDSKRNNLVQLADMAAGAIHRSFRNDRRDNARWRDQLGKRISNVWPFPNPGH